MFSLSYVTHVLCKACPILPLSYVTSILCKACPMLPLSYVAPVLCNLCLLLPPVLCYPRLMLLLPYVFPVLCFSCLKLTLSNVKPVLCYPCPMLCYSGLLLPPWPMLPQSYVGSMMRNSTSGLLFGLGWMVYQISLQPTCFNSSDWDSQTFKTSLTWDGPSNLRLNFHS